MKVEDALRKGLPTKDEDYDNLEYNPVDGEAAVADITKQLQATGTEQEFIITAVYDDRANIKEYLDNGYLKIELKGLYAQPFIEGSTKQQGAIEKYQKRQEAIVDKAIAAKIAKKVE